MSLLTLPKPDEAILGRRDEIIRQLRKLAPNATLITDKEGRRTFETDALTAYRCMPLAVVLPESTEEVSAILRYCHDNKVKVVPRGAGTSLSGGALPLEDSIVLGITRMTRVLAIDEANRVARVETGITNIAITNAAAVHGFFYAPDPSSQLACTLGGNIATNSGGAHCLKYGVTTNNLLAVRMVMMNGEVIDIGGDYLDAPGYDFLGLIVGSEGQFGVVTEATVRILKAPEGARPMLLGFNSSEAAGACVAGIIAAGIVPVAIEFMDKPAIEVCENFAGAGYPLDVEALLIVEVEGSRDEIDALLHTIAEIAERYRPRVVRVSKSAEESAAIWKGRKAAFGAIGQISDYYCMDGVIPLSKLSRGAHRGGRDLPPPSLPRGQYLPCRRRQSASAHPLQRQRPCRARARRDVRGRDSEALRQARRLPDRRARRRHREARADARAVHRRRHRPADAGEERVRPRLAAQPRQGLSARGARAPVTGNLRLGFHAPATLARDLRPRCRGGECQDPARGEGARLQI